MSSSRSRIFKNLNDGPKVKAPKASRSQLHEPISSLVGSATLALQFMRMERPINPQNPVVHCDPQILGGAPVFVGTRVPLRNLIDYLEGGHSLDEFLDDFPSVSRDQAIAALESAHEVLTASARPPR
jgi:uncharacterized protein (DUF433 family)